VPRGTQLARQWQLLQLIYSPVGLAVDYATRKLDCTVRKIWRDFDILQKSGFPLSTTTKAPMAAVPYDWEGPADTEKEYRSEKLREVLRSHLVSDEAETTVHHDDVNAFLAARQASITAEIELLTRG
jgi:hypothetical protein